LEHGIGVPKDLSRAAKFYTTAATKFGNFGAIKALGVMYLHGLGVVRSVPGAITYLTAASAGGPWGQWIRRGLDNYLTNRYSSAVLCYVHAGESGYEVAQANAAFILQKKLTVRLPVHWMHMEARSHDMESGVRGALYLRELSMSAYHNNHDSLVKIGHIFLDGGIKYGLKENSHTSHFNLISPLERKHISDGSGGTVSSGGNAPAAAYYYSSAAVLGNPLANLYMGALYHFVPAYSSSITADRMADIQRANRYYRAALQHPSLPAAFNLIVRGLIALTDMLLQDKHVASHERGATLSTADAMSSNVVRVGAALPTMPSQSWTSQLIWRINQYIEYAYSVYCSYV
jgi:TPR repeat protein